MLCGLSAYSMQWDKADSTEPWWEWGIVATCWNRLGREGLPMYTTVGPSTLAAVVLMVAHAVGRLTGSLIEAALDPVRFFGMKQ